MGLFWSRWKVIRTIWPYPDGYGVYRKNYLTGARVVLDAGLTKEAAHESARELNLK
jgi:hypothetical protein